MSQMYTICLAISYIHVHHIWNVYNLFGHQLYIYQKHSIRGGLVTNYYVNDEIQVSNFSSIKQEKKNEKKKKVSVNITYVNIVSILAIVPKGTKRSR